MRGFRDIFLLPIIAIASCAFAVGIHEGCAHGHPRDQEPVVPSVAEAPEAVSALQDSRFDEAEHKALAVLQQENRNAQAHIVAAISRYRRIMDQLATDVVTIGAGAMERGINRQYLRFALDGSDQELEAVEAHLAMASRDPKVTLELCLACWNEDWNRNGRIDDRDMLLFQVEYDANGQPIPENDPRRKPTFRFDHGDVCWARAMLNFQRSLLNVILAYHIPDPRESVERFASGEDSQHKFIVKLKHPERIHKARDLILAGMDQADRARRAYLAEIDDQGEWVPNPRQKNHPIPLPVGEELYQTWEDMLSDLRNVILGEEGIPVSDVAQLGDHQWENPPRGFIDVKKLFQEPGDIVIDVSNLKRLDREQSRDNVEAVLKDIFGEKYRKSMKPTRLVERLLRMKGEIDRGEESFGRKLRYLLWLN